MGALVLTLIHMKGVARAALILTTLLFSLACRKDEDRTAPSVQILQPAPNAQLQVPDTLIVQVQVSDERTVERVVIDVLDGQGIPIVPSAVVQVNSSSRMVYAEFRLTDERIRSGDHTIIARASDGSNEGRGFRTIAIAETPLRSRMVFVAPPFSEGSITIQRVDSTGVLGFFQQVQDFAGIAVDSDSQHLMVAGSRFTPFQAFPTAPYSGIWTVLPPGNDVPGQFTSLSVDPSDDRTYLASRDGVIRGYTGEGAQQFNALCLDAFRCDAVLAVDDRIVTWQRAIASPVERIITYAVAGTVRETFPIEMQRLAWFRRTTDRVVLFGNIGEEAVIRDLNIPEGGTPVRRVFDNGPMRLAIQLSSNEYLVALQDRIVRYQYQTDMVSTVATGINADAMAYDRATGILLVGEGQDLKSVDPNSGQVIGSLPTGSPIGHILPLANR